MYELLYIVPAPFTEKNLPDILKKIKEIIGSLGGQINKEEKLGNGKLAYPIKQVYRGFYLLIDFEIEPQKLEELNLKLKLTPEILRHIITRKIDTTAIKKESARVKKEQSIKIEPQEKIEKKEKKLKPPKIDLKKLGEKIDNLFKI